MNRQEGRKNLTPAGRLGFERPKEPQPSQGRKIHTPRFLRPARGCGALLSKTPAGRLGLHSFGPPSLIHRRSAVRSVDLI